MISMHKRLTLVLAVLLVSTAGAQAPSVQDGALQDWTRLKDTMMKIADAMPEDKFAFRATPPQRTFGEQILHGTLPRVDAFTFSAPGASWTDQQWLAQVVLALAHRVDGWNAVSLLRSLLTGLTFVFVFAACRRSMRAACCASA